VFDPHRRDTFQYAKKALTQVPDGVEVLLLSSYRDVGVAGREVSQAETEQFLRTLPPRVKYSECSLKNCYGLRHFYVSCRSCVCGCTGKAFLGNLSSAFSHFATLPNFATPISKQNFLNVPFLTLKKAHLTRLLADTARELTQAEDEMALVSESDYESVSARELLRCL
jgi:hypothetical protein